MPVDAHDGSDLRLLVLVAMLGLAVWAVSTLFPANGLWCLVRTSPDTVLSSRSPELDEEEADDARHVENTDRL